ncbi:MAG TPA: VOC family protein [Candidatus Acidoferrales bacterium]|nr:VOC family protein [Candidatus Acidoferrales bacterium]
MSNNSASVPKFQAAVFFVKDVARSKRFYGDVLGQKITMDFGANVTFEGGLSIWQTDYALNVIFEDKAKQFPVGANNAELYFDCSGIDAFFEKLSKEPALRVIHPVREHPWGQRGFRIYDPDGHIVEFGEPMAETVQRLYKQGLSVDEVAAKSLMPLEFINAVIQAK